MIRIFVLLIVGVALTSCGGSPGDWQNDDGMLLDSSSGMNLNEMPR